MLGISGLIVMRVIMDLIVPAGALVYPESREIVASAVETRFIASASAPVLPEEREATPEMTDATVPLKDGTMDALGETGAEADALKHVPTGNGLTQITQILYAGALSMSLSAHVVVIKNREVLLLQREDFKIWVLPGGHVEAGESVAPANP